MLIHVLWTPHLLIFHLLWTPLLSVLSTNLKLCHLLSVLSGNLCYALAVLSANPKLLWTPLIWSFCYLLICAMWYLCYMLPVLSAIWNCYVSICYAHLSSSVPFSTFDMLICSLNSKLISIYVCSFLFALFLAMLILCLFVHNCVIVPSVGHKLMTKYAMEGTRPVVASDEAFSEVVGSCWSLHYASEVAKSWYLIFIPSIPIK